MLLLLVLLLLLSLASEIRPSPSLDDLFFYGHEGSLIVGSPLDFGHVLGIRNAMRNSMRLMRFL
jgi:hypothetical protein